MNIEHRIPFTTLTMTAFLMAAVAGFVDAFTFVGVNHLFSAHITGNIVIAISELINHDPGIASKIIAIPFFIICAFLIALVIKTHGKTSRSLIFWLIMEASLLMIFMCGGLYYFPKIAVTSWLYFGIGMVAICAMAIHNTLLRTYMTQLPPATVMTGNLTQFTVDITNYFLARKDPTLHEKKKAAEGSLKRYGNVLLGFIIGGAFSAFGFYFIGFWSVSIVILVILAMTLQIKFI